jgi:hypothetical protein
MLRLIKIDGYRVHLFYCVDPCQKIDDEYTSGKLFNNYFDFNTVNGISKDVIVRFASGIASGTCDDLINWACYANKNQSYQVYVQISDTAMTIGIPPPTSTVHDWIYWGGATSSLASYVKSNVLSSLTPGIQITYEDSPTEVEFNWTCRLSNLLPEGSTVNNIYLDHAGSSPAPTSNGSIQLSYYSLQGELTASDTWGAGGTIYVSPFEYMKTLNSTATFAQKYSVVKVKATVESATNTHQLNLKLYVDGQW